MHVDAAQQASEIAIWAADGAVKPYKTLIPPSTALKYGKKPEKKTRPTTAAYNTRTQAKTQL